MRPGGATGAALGSTARWSRAWRWAHRMSTAAGCGPRSPAAALAAGAAAGGGGGGGGDGGDGAPRPAPASRSRSEPPPLKRHMRVVEAAVTPPGFAPVRLPEALRALLPHRYASDTAAKKACRRGEALVNGAKGAVEDRVEAGTRIEIVQRCGAEPLAAAGRAGLAVVFEDEHMACVVKPQGLPTQGRGEGTLQGRIKYCLVPSSAEGCLPRPHQAHRLDAATGGLVLVGKTRRALGALGDDLSTHRMQKRYTAVVIGRLDGEGVVDWQLDGRPAVTLFRPVAHARGAGLGGAGGAAGALAGGDGGGDSGGPGPEECWLTRVHLWPKTGRTHQLRKHLAYIGHPILGDPLYRRHHRKQGVAAERRDIGPLLAGMLEAGEGGGGGSDGGGGGGGGESDDGGGDGGGDCSGGEAEEHTPQGDAGAQAEAAAEARRPPEQAPQALEAGEADGAERERCGGAGSEPVGGSGGGAAGAAPAGAAPARQPMCLWAVELRLRHPITREPLLFSIPDPPAYDTLCPLGGAPAE